MSVGTRRARIGPRVRYRLRSIVLATIISQTGSLTHAVVSVPEGNAAAAARFRSPGRTTYYVNAQTGSDEAPGTSPDHAWRSIERVNRTAFAPGDRVLLTAGQTFRGALRLDPSSSGVKDQPVVISSAGRGRAIIDGRSGDGIVLDGCAFVVVKALRIIGCGRKNGSDGAGIRLRRTGNVEITRMEVSGFRLAGVETGGDENTRITHVYAHDNGFAGITTHGWHDGLPRSRNLYIGYCVAENNPGDPKNLDNHSGNGIVVGGLDGGLIEYCEAMNNGWDMPRDGNGPVGIWGWNCDGLVIQRCISHDNKSPGADGGGFDFDGGVTNSVMQYNLSYNNMGCGFLLCQYPGAPTWKNNVMRYNISVNDGSKNFQSGIGLWLGDTGISDAQIYNNTIVNPAHAVSTLGELPRFVYRNNIFLVGGDALIGSFRDSRFENNLYWFSGKGAICRDGERLYATLDEWSKATGQERVDGKLVGRLADPQLSLPETGSKLPSDPRKLDSLAFFRLLPDSPCVQAGTFIPDNGGHDFFGRRLPADRPPSLGAHEPQASADFKAAPR